MGMFDNLFIDIDLLPIDNKDKIKIGKDFNWVTKNFDNDLTEVYIKRERDQDGDDILILINRWEYVEVPLSERPDKKNPLYGSLKRVNERLELINYHGYVNFGNYVDGELFEFDAKFTDGNLIEIKRRI